LFFIIIWIWLLGLNHADRKQLALSSLLSGRSDAREAWFYWLTLIFISWFWWQWAPALRNTPFSAIREKIK
jgi:hypothetical protein